MAYRKSLISNPDHCVADMLKGIKAAYPALHVNPQSRIVLLNRDRRERVAILSGGGAGHEPFPAGFVGERMLTGAVGGTIFTSPPTQNISVAISNLARLNKGGVLVIILNYTGDILNFGLAIESAKSRGIKVESVVIGDDVALTGKDFHTIAGKRGICGAIFACKIAGALSSAGHLLGDIAQEVRAVNCRLASMGICLNPCSIPGSPPLFSLDEDEIEMGVGIHGEAGVGRIKLCKAEEVVKLLLTKIVKNLVISPKSKICVMINNLGTASLIEQFTIVSEVKQQLAEMEMEVVRIYVGMLMTSLDMNGIQISVLNLNGRDEWVQYLDFDTEAFAWPGTRMTHEIEKYPDLPISFEPETKDIEVGEMKISDRDSIIFRSCIKAACINLKASTSKLNELDSGCGDGDCGSTFKRFCNAVLGDLQNIPVKMVGHTFLALSQKAETSMGGTSGALYSLMFLGAAKSATDWCSAFLGGLQMLEKYSSAKLGHRTMLDALIPACQSYTSYVKDYGPKEWRIGLKLALDKAIEGCDATLNMIAKAGRASYVGPSKLNDVDAGAFAVVVWLKAIYNELTKGSF